MLVGHLDPTCKYFTQLFCGKTCLTQIMEFSVSDPRHNFSYQSGGFIREHVEMLLGVIQSQLDQTQFKFYV